MSAISSGENFIGSRQRSHRHHAGPEFFGISLSLGSLYRFAQGFPKLLQVKAWPDHFEENRITEGLAHLFSISVVKCLGRRERASL
jgi:hypothetical protein